MIDDPAPIPPPPSGTLIPVTGRVSVIESALRLQFSRSGGPGGQNVNKLNTRAQLWVPISAIVGMSESALARLRTACANRITAENELHIIAETERTQEGNRAAVLERLRLFIEQALVEPKRRRKTRPSRASKERRLEGKRLRSQRKQGRRFQGD